MLYHLSGIGIVIIHMMPALLCSAVPLRIGSIRRVCTRNRQPKCGLGVVVLRDLSCCRACGMANASF